jgi:serine/threonine-protein kinase
MPLEKLGPYRLDKLLGRGGMGAVYAGTNETTGERAAVKVLAAHLSDNADFRERFVAEVETLKKLRHPNIVQLRAYGEEGEHLFYVMELVDGRSLQDELQAGRRFTWREVARYGVDICRALKHAHDSGVIHRDLKPANLLLDTNNQVKLTDFGIAKLYGGTQITAAGGILGTADYMSPEQAEGKLVSARSDLYSLGSVLYALLAGRPPFDAKSLAEVIHKLRFEEPISVRRLSPDTPEPFETIIMQLLAKDPSKRIASAFAVANYLRAMDHALSLETQVGQITADDLPLDRPSRPQTIAMGSTDATIVTDGSAVLPPRPSGPSTEATVAGGATAELRQASRSQNLPIIEQATVMSSASGSGAVAMQPPPVRSRFVTVEEEEAQKRKRKQREEEGPPLWLLITGMAFVVLLLGGMLGYALMPASANTLYGKIQAAADSGDVEQLSGVESEVDQFLAKFPNDPRAAEVQQIRRSLDLRKRQRQLEIKARIGGGSSLSLAEQAYLEALRQSESEPEKALARFEAITGLFGGNDDDSLTVELAGKQAAELREHVAERSKEHLAKLEERLDSADKLRAESPEEARRVYRSLIDLYGDKPWAAAAVERARQSLAETPLR